MFSGSVKGIKAMRFASPRVLLCSGPTLYGLGSVGGPGSLSLGDS